jgi:hypothetical protein
VRHQQLCALATYRRQASHLSLNARGRRLSFRPQRGSSSETLWRVSTLVLLHTPEKGSEETSEGCFLVYSLRVEHPKDELPVVVEFSSRRDKEWRTVPCVIHSRDERHTTYCSSRTVFLLPVGCCARSFLLIAFLSLHTGKYVLRFVP